MKAGGSSPLLAPLELSPGLTLRNRVVFQPHFTSLGRRDGRPSEDHVAYHEARARGGVGLIVFESQAVTMTGKMSRHFVHAWEESVVPSYRGLTEAVHAEGAAIMSQLTHGGPTTAFRPPDLLWAPSQIPEPSEAWTPKAMDEADIREVITGFARASRNAVDGGFDGVEVKVAHDGLLRAFASPHFNRRTDRWGGLFANRVRLAVEVLHAVREAIGPQPVVGVRLCLSEFTDWGYDLAYGLRLAEALEGTGTLTYFNCDHGSYSSTWYEIPPFAVPEGSFRALNAGLSAATDLPVIASGRIRRPELAEEILEAGEAQLVGMARQLIADPEWVNKVAAGRRDEIRLCIACNDACVMRTSQAQPIRCVVNPTAGREARMRPMVDGDHTALGCVVVVGGGPAGLRAAASLAEVGARVVLLEAEDVLGGQIRLAAVQPLHEEISDAIEHLVVMVRRRGVELRLGTEADAAMVRELEPGRVVVATGSEHGMPGRPQRLRDDGALARAMGRHVPFSFPGLEYPHVRGSDECYGEDGPQDASVTVIDGTGHWETAGTAEFLAERGCSVEVCAAGPIVGAVLDHAGRALWQQRAAEKGITITPNLELVEVVSGGVRLRESLTGREQTRECDVVVPVLGRRSREDLFLELAQDPALSVRVIRVGDCVAPRFLEQAIAEGEATARLLSEVAAPSPRIGLSERAV